MLNYYYQVAPHILPYLKNRPQSLNRFPNGIDGKRFYHKDVTATEPDWIKMEPYTSGEGQKKDFTILMRSNGSGMKETFKPVFGK